MNSLASQNLFLKHFLLFVCVTLYAIGCFSQMAPDTCFLCAQILANEGAEVFSADISSVYRFQHGNATKVWLAI